MKTPVLNRISGEFADFPLPGQCIALGKVGSLSHGTYLPDHIDDIDYMGIVVPPPNRVLGLHEWEHWVHKKDEWDVVLYSLAKMVRLLLKSNPNVIGFLWLRPEDYDHTTVNFDLLLKGRDAFSSKRAHGAFVGYANAQLQKMQRNVYNGYMGEKRKAIVQKFGYDTKNASHCIRLLRMGIEFLNTGVLNVWRADDKEELLRIKQGAWSLTEVQQEAARLFDGAHDAYEKSPLPKLPDEARAESILMELQYRFLETRNAA